MMILGSGRLSLTFLCVQTLHFHGRGHIATDCWWKGQLRRSSAQSFVHHLTYLQDEQGHHQLVAKMMILERRMVIDLLRRTLRMKMINSLNWIQVLSSRLVNPCLYYQSLLEQIVVICWIVVDIIKSPTKIISFDNQSKPHLLNLNNTPKKTINHETLNLEACKSLRRTRKTISGGFWFTLTNLVQT